MTRRYQYVLAYINADGVLEFHGTKVTARNRIEAYQKGAAWGYRKKLLPVRGDNHTGNDWVIPMGKP